MMPFTFVFTDKELSILQNALDDHIDRAYVGGQEEPWYSKDDVLDLQNKIEKRLEW